MKRIALMTLALLLLGTVAALADSDYDLNGYDFVIGDTGDWYDGWDGCETRVYVKVLDGRSYREHYFDNLPAAFFVLREKYGAARVSEMYVPEYAGSRHLSHGHTGHGLLNAQDAWYVWDYERYSRGGLPLVLAFSNFDDAYDEAYERDANVLDFEGVLSRLSGWCDNSRKRTYWRGWHHDHWDNHRWNNSWNKRWDGWGWERSRGWVDLHFKIGDFDVNIGTGGGHRHRDHYERYHYPRFNDRYSKRDWHDHDGWDRRGHGGRSGRSAGDVASESYERDDSDRDRARDGDRSRARDGDSDRARENRGRRGGEEGNGRSRGRGNRESGREKSGNKSTGRDRSGSDEGGSNDGGSGGSSSESQERSKDDRDRKHKR